MLVVAGDFGSGKTTILERAFYDCAISCSKGRSDIFPILLPLRSFHSYDDLWSFVTTKALEKNYVSVSRSTLEKRIRQGKIAFFLDGFDEIHTGATAAERASYLARLEPLISSPCPCILTTGPTYFESFNEMHGALSKLLPGEASFDGDSFGELDLEAVLDHLDIHRSRKIEKNDLMNIVLIDVLNRDKVVEYVTAFKDELFVSTGQNVEFILEYLYKIYDLKDLLRRPLLLKMIVILIIKGGLNVNSDKKHVGPATLYSAYTWMCAKRDTRKGEADERSLQLLTDSERLSNCRELAMTMLEKGSIELGHADIVEAVTDFAQAKAKGKKPAERTLLLNRIVTDTRVCSFISNTDESTFRFTHKSFFEFFVAHAIIRNLTKYRSFRRSQNSENLPEKS
ncbi:hypothetical protein RGR602_PB00058 (plasmid) [Rhizobium gallicum bv. gallicum R602sp]|uniref:NACHT domain-containing protein n=1 Tax=Rhizobium gallicum bv. gallicum R602sp TaxID=1041138 RepID=A0A0B4XAF2_9HYPH|nr:NACHT domain-containing protein [Rhizobium gallicum]AJD43598.1 hypothetical protein RGR602_PB00058 [Rhizobium gallicum bv. gallicum R602sp]TDW34093.1 NACHT domain-containing protein [Rhizobium azibense]